MALPFSVGVTGWSKMTSGDETNAGCAFFVFSFFSLFCFPLPPFKLYPPTQPVTRGGCTAHIVNFEGGWDSVFVLLSYKKHKRKIINKMFSETQLT